jgi:SAM-dependent methyltransferase
MLAPMANEIANLSGLTGGERALDLATGTGIIARELTQLTDRVVGADISLGVLEKAQGLSENGISLAASDAHRLPFRNRVFDLVSCGLSLSHFSNVTAALREIQRVLRPGGRFIASAWGTEGESPAKTAAIEVRNKYLKDRELTFEGAFGEDVWAVVELGTETLRRVGFEDIEVKTSRLSGEHASHSDALNVALAWPITRYRISRLGQDDQRKLKEETAAAIRELDDLHWFSELHYYQANSRGE